MRLPGLLLLSTSTYLLSMAMSASHEMHPIWPASVGIVTRVVTSLLKVVFMTFPNKPEPCFVSVALICFSTHACFAQQWQKTTAPGGQWSKISCSADGAKLAAVGQDATLPCGLPGLYVSADSGATWTSLGTAEGSDVAASADGSQWMVANAYCSNFHFIYSPSSGWLTPTETNVQSSLVASSADGTKLAAAGLYPEGILISTNSGLSWQTSLTNVGIVCLCYSSDGSTLAAASSTNVIYISTNSGSTWSTNLPDSQWPGSWNAVACSAEATRIFAASADGIFASADQGGTWTPLHSPDQFRCIAASADGTQLAAGAAAGVVYTSTNAGLIWAQSILDETNAPVCTVAMTADGSKLFAASPVGSLYYLKATPPSPSLKLVAAGTNITLLWPCPSANFVLEQASDVTTSLWVNVATQPSLNLNTLENQVSLPALPQPVFYRLAAYPALASNFQDLDFESASIVPISGKWWGTVQFGAAFPGWTGYVGTNQATFALYDNMFLDSAGICLLTNSFVQEGKYSAVIEAGLDVNGQQGVISSYLSQTGTIPLEARSLLFISGSGGPFVVSLNGQDLNVVSLGGTLYGANVSNFSGTTAELRFTAETNPPPQPGGFHLFLDSISFSTRVVP